LLIETLAKDQIFYFFGIMLCAVLNVVFYAVSAVFICVAVGFVLGFPLIMGSRILLNLREMAADEVKDRERGLSLTTLQFVTHQETTHRTRLTQQTSTFV